MDLLSKLSSNRSRILRLAVVALTCVGILALFGQAYPVIDSFTSAQAYAYGNVSWGYMSQAEAARLVDREFQGAIGQLWPLAVQVIGVLAVAGLVYLSVRRIDLPNGQR